MRISVIMSVYNCAGFVGEAIESILNQTFGDFEFIIVEDCSTDDTKEIVHGYAEKDRRIVIIENRIHLGIAASVNLGLDVAGGEFIARMDGDDVSVPDRFEKQIRFMDKHPEVTVCGGWHELILLGGKKHIVDRFPCCHEDIKAVLFWQNVMSQPTVLMRRGFLHRHHIEYIQDSYPYVEDYDLWQRMIFDYGAVFVNLPEVFLYCRKHEGNTSRRYKDIQLEIARKTWGAILGKIIGADKVDTYMDLHLKVNWAQAENREEIKEILSYLSFLAARNKARKVCNDLAFRRIIARKFYGTCKLSPARGLRTWMMFLFSPWFRVYVMDFIVNHFGFFVRNRIKRFCRRDVF